MYEFLFNSTKWQEISVGDTILWGGNQSKLISPKGSNSESAKEKEQYYLKFEFSIIIYALEHTLECLNGTKEVVDIWFIQTQTAASDLYRRRDNQD